MKPINYLIVLAFLSLVKGQFNPWAKWILTQDTGAGTYNFLNQQGYSTLALSPGDGSSVDSATSCGSFSKNGELWTLDADYTEFLSSQASFVVGFWVNFESTANSAKVLQFGSDFGPHYLVTSATDGSLKVSFYSDWTSTTDSSNDFLITVPLNKWFFLAFEFDGTTTPATVNIYQSGAAKLSKNSVSGSTVPFTLPDGWMSFGQSVNAKLYEVVVAASAKITPGGIALTDSSGVDMLMSTTCTSADCSDAACPSGDTCLAWSQYCTTCSGGICSACDLNSARTGDHCQSCQALNTLKSGHCCLTANNCVECSTKSAVCDSCATGNFLYDDTVALTTACISCADSCISCKPGPSCYSCADAIVQDENSCNVDSVGFQISVEVPNIVLDFAHPLATGLSKSSFTATSSAGADVSTDEWTFSCLKGSKQCTIVTTNVKESDLPIILEIEFTQI